MDKDKFAIAAKNFRSWVPSLDSSLHHLDRVEKLVVEGTGVILPDATIAQNAELELRQIAKKIDELTGGYDFLLEALGFGPRYSTGSRRKS